MLVSLGCWITKFSFCSFGAGFQKPSKWLHNKPWYCGLAGPYSCAYKNRHFTVQGSFTKDVLQTFRQRCTPSVVEVYGREPQLGEAVSNFSASYPLLLCRRMALGSAAAHSERGMGNKAGERSTAGDTDMEQAWRTLSWCTPLPLSLEQSRRSFQRRPSAWADQGRASLDCRFEAG